MLLWLMLLVLGEGGAGVSVGPTPDESGGFARRRMGAFVKRGGVGSLAGRAT